MLKGLSILSLCALLSVSTVQAQQKSTTSDEKQAQKTAYMVADAHLDTQWNWDIQATLRYHIPKTIRQNLHLLRTYPDYIFNFEGAIKYAWMKEYYPFEYEEVKKYVQNGRWHLTGTSWDATETVVCSSESLFRNTLLGQQYFRDEFGLESTDFFLPDCFGFPYNYPTIAAHCGLIGFSSQKLQWRSARFYETEAGRGKYPFSVGLWQGIDGSRIMMTHGYDYGRRYDDEDLSQNRSLLREMSESPVNVGYRYYGTGDTGGSPNVPSVRSLVKGMKGNGPVKIVSATSDQLYKDFLPFDKHPELPVFDGELYMDLHGVGCYTSQAAMKLYNRQNEHLADAAERSSIIAEWLGKKAYPRQTITEIWRSVLLHQFHDDLPGTSIPKAYEFSWNDEIIDMKRYSDITRNAVSGVAEMLNTQVAGTPLVLFNPEGFAQKNVADVTFDNMAANYTVTDENGKKVASQVVTDTKGKRHLLVDAKVPSTGFAVYSVKSGGKATAKVEKTVSQVENSVYKLTFDKNGNLSSIVDKRYGKEMVEQGKAIGMIVFTECKSESWPAWEILKATVDGNYVVVDDAVSVRLIEDGALRKTVKVSKKYGESEISQYVRLYEGNLADRIDFYNEIEWKSLNSLLKTEFPLAVSNPNATYDLGLGSVDRCNNQDFKYEVYSHEWTDLTDKSGDYGVTIINNGKYGWDKPADNNIRLSLLWSPEVGGGYTYQARQDFGHHEFTYSIIGHKGKLDKGVVFEQSTQLNSPIRAFASTKHNGELGKAFSFMNCDNKNVTIRAFKKAEVSDEYVLRVYENSGSAQKATINFAAPIAMAVEADGTEKTLGTAPFAGNDLNVDVKAYGVKTYKLKFGNAASVRQISVTPVELPWNKRCFTGNEFKNAGDFEGGNSYAVELMPKEGITVDDIRFPMQDLDGRNGYACKGDTVALPAGNYNKVYFLAASTDKSQVVDVSLLVPNKKGNVASTPVSLNIPSYTGFIGQWGHDGQTVGYMKDAQVAYVGTHRHSSTDDEPYEFTYMFKYGVDVPKGATSIVLPKNEKVVVFSMVAVNEPTLVTPACQMFTTMNRSDVFVETSSELLKNNLLKGAVVTGKSGEAMSDENAELLIDGDTDSKWCDTKMAPNWVTFDLGAEKTIKGWRIVNAGKEGAGYITRCCELQGRNTPDGEWMTLDLLDGNRSNDVTREIEAKKARYIRLYVTGPTQRVERDACRVYELEVYGD